MRSPIKFVLTVVFLCGSFYLFAQTTSDQKDSSPSIGNKGNLSDIDERAKVPAAKAITEDTNQDSKKKSKFTQPWTVTSTVSSLDILDKPAVSSKVKTSVGPNEQLTVIGQSKDGQWYKVKTGKNVSGWISSSSVLQNPPVM